MALQKQVGINIAKAVPGDFASVNPRANVVDNDGGYVAGTNGVTVAAFAWVNDDEHTVSNTGTGAPDGFVSRNGNLGVIFNYLDGYTFTITEGFEITLHNAGDFYAIITNGGTKGQSIFASLTDGSIQAGDAGATVDGYVETKFKLAKNAESGGLGIITTH